MMENTIHLSEPNETTYAAMDAADEDKDMTGPFDSISDLMAALDS